MFNKVVVANRGAVAARVLRALNAMGIKSAAVYSEADYGAPYLEMASEAYAIGAAPARDSYLNQDVLLDVIKRSGADGVHPGYGFLSENAGFAEVCGECNITFIGPSPESIRLMGNKSVARETAVKAGVPVRWEIQDTGTSGCTNAVISRNLFDGEIALTPGQTSIKEFTPAKAGKYRFSCWMGMISGTIEVANPT